MAPRRRTTRRPMRRRRRSTRKTAIPRAPRNYRQRRQVSRARAAHVETKKNTEPVSQFKLNNTQVSYWPSLKTFIEMFKGVDNDQFIGDTVFSKYISMKLNFTFPQENYSIRTRYRIQLIHGWMTAPLAFPPTRLAPDTGPERGTVTMEELIGTIVGRIDPAFNQALDRMQFREKEKRIYKIEGKQWLKCDRDGMIAHPQTTAVLVDGMTAEDYTVGGPPDIFKQLHWKPMREVRYTYSSGGGEGEYWYPNESWIPFVAIFTPDYGQIVNHENPTQPPTDEYFPKVEVATCHWYTDS